MDYRAETELGALARDLLEDLERVRPGLAVVATGPATGAEAEAETRQAVAARLHLRLGELYREQCQSVDEEMASAAPPGPGSTDLADPTLPLPLAPAEPAQLVLYRRELDQILLPRYAALACQQNRWERTRESRRGLDGYNRAAYAALFFFIGLFIVWAPFIPIWEKWIPFALAAVAPLMSPFLPDLHRFAQVRAYRLSLLTLLVDVDEAGKALPMPELSPHRELPPHDTTPKGSLP